MRCPECVAEGKRSFVSVGGSTVTLMYFPSFYDEDGAYHSHDGNRISTSYSCSNGHQWHEGRVAACPTCGDWQAERESAKAEESA